MSNPLEPVDVVDTDGNVLRTITKKEAHETGALHKCVIGQVIDSSGRWLLIKQAGDRQDAGQYVSPMGGHVGAGESDDDAFKRELQEELGIEGEFEYTCVGRAIFDRHVIGRHENHLCAYYVVISDAEPVLSNESVSCEYFTKEQLKSELKNNPQNFGDAFY